MRQRSGARLGLHASAGGGGSAITPGVGPPENRRARSAGMWCGWICRSSDNCCGILFLKQPAVDLRSKCWAPRSSGKGSRTKWSQRLRRGSECGRASAHPEHVSTRSDSDAKVHHFMPGQSNVHSGPTMGTLCRTSPKSWPIGPLERVQAGLQKDSKRLRAVSNKRSMSARWSTLTSCDPCCGPLATQLTSCFRTSALVSDA